MPTKKAKITKSSAKKPAVKKATLKQPSKNKLKTKSVKILPKAKKAKPAQVKKPVKKVVQKTSKITIKKPAKKPVTKTIKKAKTAPIKTKIVSKQSSKKISVDKKSNLRKEIFSKVKKPLTEFKAPEKTPEVSISTKFTIAKKPEPRIKTSFKIGDYAVYPSHGVGKIIEIEKTVILGQDFSCYLMYFEKEKLTIKIPVSNTNKIGIRHLVSKEQMDEVFVILRSGVKKLKGMWSRRAQEYETKINSGDIILLAEVLRDLTRDIEDGDRSYSERIIYETAIYRLSSEYSIIYGTPLEESKEKVILTAKDKLNSEGKIIQKDDFDDFDDVAKSDLDEDEEEEESEDEDEEEDDDYDYDDEDDDDKPKRGRKRK
jgi:CarD family transcriptional regulator